MQFETCPLCDSDDWVLIDAETLLTELTNEQIDMMIWFKATIRTASAKYRRFIPEVIKDWAKL